MKIAIELAINSEHFPDETYHIPLRDINAPAGISRETVQDLIITRVEQCAKRISHGLDRLYPVQNADAA